MRSCLAALLSLLLLAAAHGEFDLHGLLASVAVDNIVILSEVNCGYLAFASNWLAHASRQGVRNFLFVSEDEAAHEHLRLLAPGHVASSADVLRLQAAQLSAEDEAQHGFGSRAFGALMARRSHYVRAVLAAGFSALLMDLDTVLLRNPLPYLPAGYDYVGVYDSHPTLEWGRRLCTCLMLLRPSPAALALVERWAEVCAHAGEDQLCFNGIFPELPLSSREQADAWHPTSPAARLGNGTALSTFVLPRQLFPSGNCLRDYDASLLDKWNGPVWVHANWLRTEQKQPFLAQLGLWAPSSAHTLPVCRNASGASHVPSRRRALSVQQAADAPACPRYIYCSLVSGGLGDLLEHYTHCLYVAQLIQATLVLSGDAFTMAPHKHLGHEDYPAAAELLGINTTSAHPPNVSWDLSEKLQWQDALSFSRGGNASIPCNKLLRAGMADCPIRWCSNDPDYRGLQAVRWKLRSMHPRQKCLKRGLGFPPRAAGDPLRVLWHVRTGDVHTDTGQFGALLVTLRALADSRRLRVLFESQDELPARLRETFREEAEFAVGSPLLQVICRFLTADVLVITGSSFPALIAAFAPPWTPVVLEERRKNRFRNSSHAHHYFTADEALLLEDGTVNMSRHCVSHTTVQAPCSRLSRWREMCSAPCCR